jgi:predicted phage terminase large subunit-like protein
MPPRHGKSELVSKYFPAWYLGRFPQRNVILTSATDELAKEFGAAARDVFREHGGLFGQGLASDATAAHRWKTTAGGGLRAAGVGGGIMGRGANLLIIDDYFKNVEEALSEMTRRAVHQWYMSTAKTRLAPNGAVVIVATRWHPKDLIGSLLDQAEMGDDKWTRIRFPAIAEEADTLGRKPGEALWPEWFPIQALRSIEKGFDTSGYPWMWGALYQQDPPGNLNSEFPREWFGERIWFDAWPDPTSFVCKVVCVDPSLGKTNKSDYSAIVSVGLDGLGRYWVDADLQRRPSTQIVADSLRACWQFEARMLGVEAVAFQQLLCEQMRGEAQRMGRAANTWVQEMNQSIDKSVRIRSLAPLLATGAIRFKRGSPGNSLMIEQLMGFPAHKHDDGPDALEMAVRLIGQLMRGEIAYGTMNEERVYA